MLCALIFNRFRNEKEQSRSTADFMPDWDASEADEPGWEDIKAKAMMANAMLGGAAPPDPGNGDGS